MKITDVFDLSFYSNKEERAFNVTLRIFGIDIDISLYGFLDSWIFPILVVPSLRGMFFQSLFLGIFVGRLKESN